MLVAGVLERRHVVGGAAAACERVLLDDAVGEARWEVVEVDLDGGGSDGGGGEGDEVGDDGVGDGGEGGEGGGDGGGGEEGVEEGVEDDDEDDGGEGLFDEGGFVAGHGEESGRV